MISRIALDSIKQANPVAELAENLVHQGVTGTR